VGFTASFSAGVEGVVGVVGVVGIVGVVGVVGVASGPQAAITRDSSIKPLTTSQTIFLVMCVSTSFFLLRLGVSLSLLFCLFMFARLI
jgi:hypothetical protein